VTVFTLSWGRHALEKKSARCFHELLWLTKCVLESQPPMHSAHRKACETGVDTAGVCSDLTCVHTLLTLTL